MLRNTESRGGKKKKRNTEVKQKTQAIKAEMNVKERGSERLTDK